MTPDVRRAVLNLMEGLNCARSLTVAMMVKAGEWDQLVRLKVDPTNFLDAETYHRWTIATDLLRKCADVPVQTDAKLEALLKWKWAEKECFLTNQRLNEYLDFGTLSGVPPHVRIVEFFDDVKKHLQWLIGDGPPVELDGVFGPGATVSDRSGATTALHKMSSTPTFTPDAFGYLLPWLGTKWASACAARHDVPVSTRGNVYFSVTKTALTERPCAKEPSINAYYQRAQGLVLRRRLEARGFNFERAQEVHQREARKGSISNDSCTIDLTSASDCKCYALVRLACSQRWFDALSQTRSPLTEVGGKWHRVEKFSSMGNGFTFELETAIFAAICLAVNPALRPGIDLFVFGDDIIVPKEDGEAVVAALKFLGFTPNPGKTFLSGDFRESCGGDFFRGTAVRGFFLEEYPSEPQDWISFANGIRRVSGCLFNDIRRAWFSILDCIPAEVRKCRGPEELGDICIHDNTARWSTRTRSSIRWVKVYRPHRYEGTDWERFDGDTQLAGALYGVRLKRLVRDGQPGSTRWDPKTEKFLSKGREYVIGRDAVISYKVGWTRFS